MQKGNPSVIWKGKFSERQWGLALINTLGPKKQGVVDYTESLIHHKKVLLFTLPLYTGTMVHPLPLQKVESSSNYYG